MGQLKGKQVICQPPPLFRKKNVQKVQETAEGIALADLRAAAAAHGPELGVPEKIVEGHLVEPGDFNGIIQAGLMYAVFIVGDRACGAAKKGGQFLLPDILFLPKQFHTFR